MFKKSLLLFVMLSSLNIFADELKDDCEAAVDAADRLNTSADKHCDYSNTGLNGVLHRAFAPKSDAQVTSENKQVVEAAAAKKVQVRVQAREFDSAQQLVAVRYELLQLSSQECTKGFVVDSERYVPVNAQRLKLELDYHCL